MWDVNNMPVTLENRKMRVNQNGQKKGRRAMCLKGEKFKS